MVKPNLEPLDYCFYCGVKIPKWTFPHICIGCLGIIRDGGQLVTKLIQANFDDSDADDKELRVDGY